MKVTLDWLKQYVDFDWSPEELAERLTMLGIEVERVEKIAGEFEGVVVAQVLTRDKHPNADKLSLCRVDDGKGQRQIVCGAHNFKPGDKVPLILPGFSLPAAPGRQRLTIHTPLVRLTKAQIIQKGLALGVDYSLTSSCYDPSPSGEACGECGNFTLVRNGTCLKCDTCGGTSGCS